jgi:hypothetical protein
LSAIDNLNANIQRFHEVMTNFNFGMHTGGMKPIISGIILSNNTFNGGSSSGTVVGNISVTVQGGTFSGTLGLTGTDAPLFQIVGNQLETNGVLPGGTYDINIVATQNGYKQSPFSSNFPITGISAQNFSSLTLDNFTFTPTGLAAVDVGNVSIVMNPVNPTSTATITLGGADAGSFQLTNGGVYPCKVQAKQNIGVGTYHITLTATQTSIGNSPFTSNILTITGVTAQTIATLTLTNDGGSASTVGIPTQSFGWIFADNDATGIPVGKVPQFLFNGTPQPFSASVYSQRRYYPSGRLMFCTFALRPTFSTLAGQSSSVSITNGGTSWPNPSGRTLANDIYTQNLVVDCPVAPITGNGFTTTTER